MTPESFGQSQLAQTGRTQQPRRMAMSRADREELTRRQAALTGLTKNPNWPEFVAEWKREIARIERRMLREANESRGANQRDLDFLRGFKAALAWQIAVPHSAERKLLSYLRSQGIEIEEEEMIDV